MSTYCAVALEKPHHKPYHDHEYGFPTDDERVIFERLSYEIMQAGLSWDLIIRKRDALNEVFHDFVVDKVAKISEDQILKMLDDARIIRSRKKIEAIITNARRVQGLRKTNGGLAGWLAAHHPSTEKEWLKHFKSTFVFVGPEVIKELMMGIGYFPGSHREDCPVYKKIAKLKPPWMSDRA